MIIGISVALIAVAFAVLVIFLIKTLNSAQKSLDKTTQTLQEVQQTINELSYEVKQTVRHANDITVDLQHKLNQVDPVMDSVKNLGEVLSEVTLAAKQASASVIHKFKQAKRDNPKRQLALPASSTPEERTIQSYAAAYGTAGAKPGSSVLKWVDTAASVWQRLRH